jgi:O-antigen ligase
MNSTPAPSTPFESPWRDWPVRALQLALVIAVGVILGVQYFQPEKRTIALMAAIVVFGIAWRIDMVSGLCFLVMLLPFPKGMIFGSSSIAFILLLLVIWLLRIGQRQSPAPRRTPIDVPIAGLLIAYVLSYTNLTDPKAVEGALQNTSLVVACVVMFYLIVSNLRSEQALQRLHSFQAVSVFGVMLLAVWELNHPGATFIRGWIQFKLPESVEVLNIKDFRVGGPFYDYELLCEFCALNLLLILYMFLRAQTLLRRTLLGMLLALTTFILFATVTRGGVIALAVGTVYLLWVVRRQLRLVPFVMVSSAVVAALLAMNFYVANFTHSGDLFERLMRTTFHYGVIPDDRLDAWSGAWQRFLEHPILGHGPMYTPMTGTRLWFWPHNGYLYIANLVGLLGLGFFAAILWGLFRATLPSTHSFRDPSYARSYLLIAHTQLIVFMVDQIKIDYLRNAIYQFQVWLMFSMMVSAALIARRSPLTSPRPS